MKRLVMTFLATLLMMTAAFSQVISTGTAKDSTVLITPTQLKETNLIFTEHRKLLTENNLLYKQLTNYKNDNAALIRIDSLREQQIDNYKLLSSSYEAKIADLNKQINKKEKTLLLWKVGGVTVSTGLLLFLLLK